jgi:hypothetical protein
VTKREEPGRGVEQDLSSVLLPGTVEFITNLGSRVIYEVRLQDGNSVCAEVQRTDRSEKFTVGEPLVVIVNGDHCVLLEDSGTE